MKLNLLKIGLITLVITGCANQASQNLKESMYSRLLVADEASAEVKVITPRDNQITHLTLPSQGENYLTTSGNQRFGIVTQPANNRVYFVDAAVENHGDHAHLRGEIHLAKVVSNGTSPAHNHTLNERFVIFNDGNNKNKYASYTIGRESSLNSSRPLVEKKVSVNHHGSAVLFMNGNVVVTEKSAKAPGALPDMISLRDKQNKVLKRYRNIPPMHGNAGDGEIALFGSQAGIVIVTKADDCLLIPAPANFNSERGNWFGQVMYGEGSEQFIAIARNHGVYRVDPEQKIIEPLIESNQIKRTVFDNQGKDLVVIEGSDSVNTIGIFDINKKKYVVKRPINLSNNDKASAVATRHYVYVALNESQKVLQLRRSDLKEVGSFDVSPLKPSRMIFIGADLDEGDH